MLPLTKLRSEETTQEAVSIRGRFGLRTSSLWRIAGYTLLWWALLLWASLAPSGSFWFNGTAQASPASQVMAACAILNAFFIPFVIYFPATQTEGHLNSFNFPVVVIQNSTWIFEAGCGLLVIYFNSIVERICDVCFDELGWAYNERPHHSHHIRTLLFDFCRVIDASYPQQRQWV